MNKNISGFVWILMAFLALGLAYGLVVPPFENLDEIEHFGVVRYIADTGRLPVHGTPAAKMYHYRQEASQPPLYYLLSAGLVRVLGLRADDAEAYLRFNPRVACGPGAPFLYDNRAILYHNPHLDRFPWQGTLRMLHLLRVWSTLLQSLTVVGTYVLARRVFPGRPEIHLLAMAIVAFNPQFLFVASGVNNDNLVTPLATWGLYLVLRIWQEGLSLRRAIGLGFLIGLVGLSKLSGWLLLPLALGVILLRALHPLQKETARSSSKIGHRSLVIGPWSFAIGPWSLAIGHSLLIILPALALSGWWFWRNWLLYGDPTALAPMLQLVSLRGSPIYPWNEAGLVFRSFWGQIPCSFYPAGFYVLYVLLTALGVIGLAWGWRRLAPGERWAIALCATWFLLAVAGWMRWNLTTPAPGGRLLFPALPAVALLLATGISGISSLIGHWSFRHWSFGHWSFRHWSFGHWSFPRWSLVILSLVILLFLSALWVVAGILPAFYAPPPRYPDAVAVRSQHRVDAHFGDSIRLVGYDLQTREAEHLLDVTLYWQANAQIHEDYIMALQLVSPVPGDDTLRWTYDSWPGHGNYPTSAWRTGEVIRDRYRFRLPAADFLTQAWDLQVVLYEPEKGGLPVRVGETSVGNRLILHRLRLSGEEPACPESGRLSSDVRLGESVALTHAEVVAEPDGAQVLLCWKSFAPLDRDYQVFVHLYDASGTLVAAGDGPPMDGAFPSSLWQPGDVVLDIHRLPALVEGGRVAVGLYRLDDGTRLPATVGGEPVPDAAVPIWPIRP